MPTAAADSIAAMTAPTFSSCPSVRTTMPNRLNGGAPSTPETSRPCACSTPQAMQVPSEGADPGEARSGGVGERGDHAGVFGEADHRAHIGLTATVAFHLRLGDQRRVEGGAGGHTQAARVGLFVRAGAVDHDRQPAALAVFDRVIAGDRADDQRSPPRPVGGEDLLAQVLPLAPGLGDRSRHRGGEVGTAVEFSARGTGIAGRAGDRIDDAGVLVEGGVGDAAFCSRTG